MTDPDIVTEIVEAVAAADGVDPTELDPLYEYINPEALVILAKQERREWSLTFQFSDHQVTVSHDSRILVDGVAYSPDVSNSFDA
ncbi:hypothetical protein SY89_00106 [Halolamina pelagica]|uniref:Halobacterial output domain-containing protein n=1 Tax=Halolamina pelagica TaxID=699431 RepID=A0A0P7HYJ5_9EURY|nr:HalOD1 output domain-containing protein [Halolamina pelagica]KPN29393.1 hypothetical protein SY89_00106 [Halolamina pelagica]